jgi:hypothetical protein
MIVKGEECWHNFVKVWQRKDIILTATNENRQTVVILKKEVAMPVDFTVISMLISLLIGIIVGISLVRSH